MQARTNGTIEGTEWVNWQRQEKRAVTTPRRAFIGHDERRGRSLSGHLLAEELRIAIKQLLRTETHLLQANGEN